MRRSTVPAIAKNRVFMVAVCAVTWFGATCGCTNSTGTSGTDTNSNSTATSAPKLAPEEILKRMVAAYQSAKSYADSGRLRFRFRQGDDEVDESPDLSTTFVRPGKLRLHAYQAIVICDGKEFHATIGDLEGQVLTAKAAGELKTEDIYRDAVLSQVLNGQLGAAPFQLGLLLDAEIYDKILEGADTRELLEPKKVDGEPCFRVQLGRADGEMVFWIDQNSYVLRRLEYPTRDLKETMERSEGDQKPEAVHGLAVVAEFKGAKLNPKLPKTAFQFEIPPDARQVAQFDTSALIPPPEPPSRLLGKQVPGFSFTGLDGKTITRESLANKVVVLDFWAAYAEPCLTTLPALQEVYEAHKDRVVFLAVNIDEAKVKDRELTSFFADHKWTVPICRDLDYAARDIFLVEGLPNLFIIGPDGIVQDNEVGANPARATELPARLEKVLAGENVFQEALVRHQARMQEYEDQVRVARANAASENELKEAEIAPRSEPALHALGELWHNGDVAQPGNILVIEGDGSSSRILVIDGMRGIAEISPEGGLLARHELDLPAGESGIITYLRSAKDGEGKRWYLCFGPAQQQVHLFDEEWKLALRFPKEGEHAGIADAQLADLDGDGQIEINLGYYGDVGVQCVSLAGDRVWSKRELTDVYALAVTAANSKGQRSLLCSNGRGLPTLVNFEGRMNAPDRPTTHAIWRLIGVDLDGDGAPEFAGVAAPAPGADSLVGISVGGSELWRYRLPPGVQRHPSLEVLTGGNLLGTKYGQWVTAGADGSIHIVNFDGSKIDQFAYGEALTGLALAAVDGAPALLVATPQGLTAWRMEPREAH